MGADAYRRSVRIPAGTQEAPPGAGRPEASVSPNRPAALGFLSAARAALWAASAAALLEVGVAGSSPAPRAAEAELSSPGHRGPALAEPDAPEPTPEAPAGRPEAPAPRKPGSSRPSGKKPPEAPARNLLPNGELEKGRGVGPDGWERPDELTTFWVPSPGRRGRSIRIDTDVLASQFREREKELARAREAGEEPPPPPRKLPTKDPKYDTVAGLDGVHFASGEIPLDPRAFYRLEVDVRADVPPGVEASPRVWVKALARVTSRSGARDRVVWKKSLVCKGAGPEWRTFRMVFPAGTRFPAGADRLRVELYPYWPPATYDFDDVRLFEVDEEEVRRFQEEQGRTSPGAGSGGGSPSPGR